MAKKQNPHTDAAKRLKGLRKITRQLEALYPELGPMFRLHEQLYLRSIINTISAHSQEG